MKTIVIKWGTSILLAVAGVTLSTGDPPGTKDWIAELAKHAGKVKRDAYPWAGPVIPASEAPKTIKAVTADPGVYVFDGVIIRELKGEEARQYLEARYARENQVAREVGRAQELVYQGKLREARSILVPLVRENGTDSQAVNALADIALREGRYQEALALLWPILHPHASEQTIIRATIASAMTNRGSAEMWAEMKAYCDQISMRAAGGLNLLDGSIPNTVQSSGFVAMAAWYKRHGYTSSARFFFERALRWEASNPWVQFSLGKIYYRAKEWPKAVRAYSAAARRGRGTLKTLAEQELRNARYLMEHSR